MLCSPLLMVLTHPLGAWSRPPLKLPFTVLPDSLFFPWRLQFPQGFGGFLGWGGVGGGGGGFGCVSFWLGFFLLGWFGCGSFVFFGGVGGCGWGGVGCCFGKYIVGIGFALTPTPPK